MNLIRIIVLLLLATPALAQRPIEVMPLEWPNSGSIVIPVAEGETLTGLAAELDERTGGALTLAVAEGQFKGERGQTLTLFGVKPYSRIDLIGVGSESVDRVGAEDFGGLAASVNDGTSGTTVQILWSGIERQDDATAARVAFGFRLGDYRFDRYQQERLDPATRGAVVVMSDDPGAASQFAGDLEHVAAAVYLARDLSSEPGNIIYPQSFVDRVRAQFDGLKNVKIRVLDEQDLERLGAGAHLGVGGGSSRPPRLLVIEYFAGGERPTLALAGKGITFDTGGVSLKRGDGMWKMKGDMTGAAVVSATVLAAARRRDQRRRAGGAGREHALRYRDSPGGRTDVDVGQDNRDRLDRRRGTARAERRRVLRACRVFTRPVDRRGDADRLGGSRRGTGLRRSVQHGG